MFGFFKTTTFTDSWRRNPRLTLHVELGDNTLNGLPLGERIDRFSFLGPAESPKAVRKEQVLNYYTLGVAIGFDHEDMRVHDFQIWWQDYLDKGFAEFKGDVTYQGKPLARAGHVSRETILDLLGAPYHTDRDADEEILFYSAADYEWQFECALDGALKALLIVDNPLMADESFRLSCGLNKPWPPESNA